LRFATKAEADANVLDLYSRWTAVSQYRSVETDDPVNSTWDLVGSGRLTHPLPRSPVEDLVVTPITDVDQFINDLFGQVKEA